MERNTNRIAFFGSDEIALPFLRSMLGGPGNPSVVAVLTQPDRKSGRGRKFRMNPVKEWALGQEIPCRDPLKPGAEDVRWLQARQVDVVMVMAYGHILGREFLEFPPLGCFNLHASLLPSYRGASPIETAIAMGERETGVTLMRVVPRMDSGPVLDFERIAIDHHETGSDLRGKIAQACIPLVQRNLEPILERRAEEVSQDEKLATYCRKLGKEDGRMDFNSSSRVLVDRARAFRAWPGLSFPFGEQRIRLGECLVGEPDKTLLPGEVFCDEEFNLWLGTGEACILVRELQRPGGRMLSAADFLRGFELPNGTVLPSEPMPDLLVSRKSRPDT